MITWAICWLLAQIMVGAVGKLSLPIGVLFLTGMLDVVIIFLIACAVRGWPKF